MSGNTGISRFGHDTQECLLTTRKIQSVEKNIFEREKIDTEVVCDKLLIVVI